MIEATTAHVVALQDANPADDFTHPVGDDPSWSESYYFYYFDAARGIGGITRMGFRANDGWKDYMHIVFLEGRHIVFCYEREDMASADEPLTVGGLTLERVEPFKAWKIVFDGKGQDLDDGRILITPKRDRPEGWLKLADVAMEIDFQAVTEPVYMFSEPGARGHFEQPGVCRGFITVNGERREFSGLGLRDKSWGPRPWRDTKKDAKAAKPFASGAASGLFNMWITSVMSEDLAFALTFSHLPDGAVGAAGFLFKDGAYHQMLSGSIASEFEEGSLVHKSNRFTAEFENGHAISGTGEIINLGPSKIPMPQGATLVNSGVTRFTLDTGETGLGSSEYWFSVTR
jgi:hypothetical protein